MTMAQALIVLAAMIASLAAAFVMLPRQPATVDEVWFLRVAMRVQAGERLYADVFYEAGPLAVWLATWFVPTARRLRFVSAVVYALTLGLLLGALAMIGGSPIAMLGAALAMIGLTGPAWPTDNLYGLVSRLGLAMSAFGLAVAPCAPHAWIGLAALGMAIALLSKYNLGVCGLLVIVGPILSVRGLPEAATLVLASALLACLAALVLWRQGILPAFFVRAVQNKRTYLRTARLTIREGIRQTLRAERDMPAGAPATRVARLAFMLIGLALPCVVVAGHVLARSAPAAEAAIAVLLLGSAALLALWPRADWEHVGPALPLVFAALPAAMTLVWPAGEVAAGVLLALAGLYGLASASRVWSLPEVSMDEPAQRYPWVERRAHGFSTQAFAGVPAGCYMTGARLRAGNRLREITGGKVLVLRHDAAVWYVGCGLINPTAFDFPIAPAFGAHGQSDVIAALRSGEVVWCCFEPSGDELLRPVELEAFVPAEMELVADTALGGLYRSRGQCPE